MIFLNRRERKVLERVAFYLELARSYRCGEDRDKAVLMAVERLELVLKVDGCLRKRLSDALKVTFGA